MLGEELSLDPAFRDQFDFATARAVADLQVLCELCLPYVKPGGRFLAMKAAECEEEVSQAGRAVSVLGGRLLPAFRYPIPGFRCGAPGGVGGKALPTPKGYPRRGQDTEVPSKPLSLRIEIFYSFISNWI